MARTLKIAPSLLSANFARLEEAVHWCEAGGADVLHVDVMDGHFVPNITIGPVVVQSLRAITKLTLDCHLMIEDADRFVSDFAKAGADWVSVHVEACPHVHRTLQLIKSCGMRAGIAINPGTSLSALNGALPEADYILLMSVNPGFGGQAFIPSLYQRAQMLREELDRRGRQGTFIEADGGLKLDNIKQAFDAGVDVMVSGSGVFGATDVAARIRALKAM
jgi:ribulose-phosphate 3-epimerase